MKEIALTRNYKYRIYPNKTQTALLERALELHCEIYNAALEERREAWRRCKTFVSVIDQQKELTGIRKVRDDIAFLNVSSCERTLRRLDKAFQAFFRRIKSGCKPGYPRFKSIKRFNTIEFKHGDGASAKSGRLYLQRIGNIKVNWSRPIPDSAKIKCVYVKRENNKWFAVFCLELPSPDLSPHVGPVVGLDAGLCSLAALSDGRVIENPRWFRASEEKLAKANRILSRRKKFSGRWRQASMRVASIHAKIANQRRDFQHKLSTELTRTYSLIAIEDLNILGLSRSHVSKSVHDAAWGQLFQMLDYKVENTGSRVVRVDPRHTSQICSGCGCIVQKDLSVRVHSCPDCDLTIDRDVNAARNILTLALQC